MSMSNVCTLTAGPVKVLVDPTRASRLTDDSGRRARREACSQVRYDY